MSSIPPMKDLNGRLLRAAAVGAWLDEPMLPRMPAQAVMDIDQKLGAGRGQPDDALMYLRLNVTRWRVDDYAALGWNEILELDLSSGRLPLLRAEDGRMLGVVTTVAKGAPGHLARWSEGRDLEPTSFTTWEALFTACVEKAEAGAVAKDPLRIVLGLP